MALIVRIDPPFTAGDDGTATVHARPYRKSVPEVGDEVFVWTSDSAGGHGLAARGVLLSEAIEEVPNADGVKTHKELVLGLRITHRAATRPLALAEILPTRDDEPPEAPAGKQLYKHALNKVIQIESGTADFVRSHFEG